MKNNIVKIDEIDNSMELAKALMNTGHYKRLGQEGVFLVLEMAKSLGVDKMQALNGGFYPVQGKVEMSGQLMMALIRQAGHSVTKDKRSTDTNCILHGKRKDTGDTWTESFGIEDAKKAGLLSGATYSKYGKLMFQWRALSSLARFLFPDVIKGCYVMGEISDAPPLSEPVNMELEEIHAKAIESGEEIVLPGDVITDEQLEQLEEAIGDNETYRNQLLSYIKKQHGADSLKMLPAMDFERALNKAKKEQ